MKLVNKNTTNRKVFGEIVPCNEYDCIAVKTDQGVTWYYRSLAELNEEWEDYEEPKTSWYITAWGDVYEYSQSQFAIKQKQVIGNYFESEEEAEKAVEKLRAYKRLRDNGFRFIGLGNDRYGVKDIKYRIDPPTGFEENEDLHLLFGGEE